MRLGRTANHNPTPY